MKKIFCLYLMLSFLLFFVGVVFARNELNLIKAKGTVNTAEIGGKGLYVFSMWERDSTKNSFVNPDGSFVTVISDVGMQKLSVRDNKNAIRALAIVFPQNPDNIVFDAESTAMAVLLCDPTLLFPIAMIKLVAEKKSFQDLTAFLKKNLPLKSLEELVSDDEYISLMRACNKEIFNEDEAAIRKSLYKARGELENLLQ